MKKEEEFINHSNWMYLSYTVLWLECLKHLFSLYRMHMRLRNIFSVNFSFPFWNWIAANNVSLSTTFKFKPLLHSFSAFFYLYPICNFLSFFSLSPSIECLMRWKVFGTLIKSTSTIVFEWQKKSEQITSLEDVITKKKFIIRFH